MESVDINWWNIYIYIYIKYIGRCKFRADTRGKTDEKGKKSVFLTAAGKEAFILLNMLVKPITLRDASIAEIQWALLWHVSSNWILMLQHQVSECKFELNDCSPELTVLGKPRSQLHSSITHNSSTNEWFVKKPKLIEPWPCSPIKPILYGTPPIPSQVTCLIKENDNPGR